MAELIKETMTKVLTIGAGVGLVGLVLGIVYLSSTRGKDMTNLARTDGSGEIEIPPIDAAAPTETATATFALG